MIIFDYSIINDIHQEEEIVCLLCLLCLFCAFLGTLGRPGYPNTYNRNFETCF